MKTFVSIALVVVAVCTSRAQVMEKAATDQAGNPLITTGTVAPPSSTYISRAKVMAAFEKGQTLAETPGYKVMASRREKPGVVEIHTYETDVFYIVEGTASFVTGGTCADAKATGPGQLRGTSITGGATNHLSKGDVIIVPAGQPHQFAEVSNPFLHLTVKPIKAP
jgi:mannose-6-phosphate isomerase-like protein (cupin superfamily)